LIKILVGDCIKKLKTLLNQSINTCITSPPYWGLRDYGESKQLGLEDTPEEYVANLVQVFKEVKRVLRDDGTVWLNLGDSYLQNKQLGGLPWRVAFALQQDGWYLRQDIIWHKPNPMPESVTDRCTKSHEYIFLLSKSSKYYFDNESIKEDSIYAPNKTHEIERAKGYYDGKWSNPEKGSRHDGSFKAIREKRNKRSVWTISPKPFKDAHFATFPIDLIEPCVLAGCPEGGTVLDPFGGSGTTGIVANNHFRNSILIELNSNYVELAKKRIEENGQLFCDLVIKWSENGR
jgi:DNA modification methylase